MVASMPDEYICSDKCLDKYTLSGNEEPLWRAIDQRVCAGASISRVLSEKWMPYLDNVPLGCPLKDVSAIAIRQGKGLDIYLC